MIYPIKAIWNNHYFFKESVDKSRRKLGGFCFYLLCDEIIRQNTDKYICIGNCENGDEFFVRFKFTKWPDETFSVSRIIYEMDEEHGNYYNIRKQQAEEARISAMFDSEKLLD